ncbi:MAG: Mth938-like domain-containing protein [Candidatus Marinimicrobia bacterium]|nr:Mth938-like domain-containing protein [Candidatus Neomarinimicrobiota bacterium]MDP6594214.1 Mth938-like domain-containing protein [Candidatus Neomarinimicrobiota bacterium]MDP6837121.1 Mth938-like domain-containing protein [Candidatus Neomarinimicrobiota bacterium]|tara:strand:- start:1200 stop:1571 length:372 start_codon:yes stop_codon:yes gene_type:complete
MNSRKSPGITSLSWGQMEVAHHGVFKDIKAYPGGVRAWDWNETGTRHSPGIQPADVEELVNNSAEVIVLSRGMLKRLKVCPETLTMLEEKGITCHVLPTEEAVDLYNDLSAEKRVGGLFHSTC